MSALTTLVTRASCLARGLFFQRQPMALAMRVNRHAIRTKSFDSVNRSVIGKLFHSVFIFLLALVTTTLTLHAISWANGYPPVWYKEWVKAEIAAKKEKEASATKPK